MLWRKGVLSRAVMQLAAVDPQALVEEGVILRCHASSLLL
jgi:hypothetical protein